MQQHSSPPKKQGKWVCKFSQLEHNLKVKNLLPLLGWIQESLSGTVHFQLQVQFHPLAPDSSVVLCRKRGVEGRPEVAAQLQFT